MRRLAGSALSVVAIAALAGCGGEADDGPAAGGTPSASTSPSPSATASPSASAPPSSKPAEQPSASAEPTLDRRAFTRLVQAALDDTQGARLTVDNGLGLLSGEGVADFRTDPTSLAMTLSSTETGDDQRLTVRVIDDSLLVQDAGGWLRLDVDSPANPFGRSLSDQLDPRRVLAVVAEELTSATAEGEVERDGETLTAYRAIADGPAVAQALAPDLAGQEGVVVPATVTCDLAVDADGRARRITVGLGEEVGSISYTLTGWGTSADLAVAEPPAAQVEDLTDLP